MVISVWKLIGSPFIIQNPNSFHDFYYHETWVLHKKINISSQTFSKNTVQMYSDKSQCGRLVRKYWRILFREETILFLLYVTLCKASESAAVHCKPWSWIWIKMFQSVLVLLCYVIRMCTVQNLHILCSATSHQCSPLRNPCQCFPLHFGFWIQMQVCLEINLGPLRTQKPSPHYKILSNYKFLFVIPYFIVQVCFIHCTTVLITVVDKVIFKWENSRFSIKLL